jgi:glyoxylase-like metal-dependent hydrolase (beta-lactamase superfamily II)
VYTLRLKGTTLRGGTSHDRPRRLRAVLRRVRPETRSDRVGLGPGHGPDVMSVAPGRIGYSRRADDGARPAAPCGRPTDDAADLDPCLWLYRIGECLEIEQRHIDRSIGANLSEVRDLERGDPDSPPRDLHRVAIGVQPRRSIVDA